MLRTPMNPLKQSFAWWAFSNRGVEAEALLRGAAKIGYAGVEFLPEELWPLAGEAGLKLSAINGHGTLEDGLNKRSNAARITDELSRNIDKAAGAGVGALICFSGSRQGLGDAEGIAASAEVLARIAPAAEKAGVKLVVELLNSRVDHRDYQADRTAWGVELCEQVGSPAVRLLYDIYHMQIMEGDVIRTIEREHRWIGHYHTAGNPGRGLFDDTQELNYPPIFRAIQRTGFAGFVGHEFIPKGDPLVELAHAYRLTADAMR